MRPLYRADIDGLRALAVLAVILNHGWEKAIPNGYLGVDVFFVISGFVITASLAHRESSTLGDLLSGFYMRRIKRLVPALVACVLLTSLMLSAVEENMAATLRTGAAALVGFSNVFLYAEATDYFGTAAELNGFTQTWSLGVEEQFYFVFPFLVWLTGFGRRGATGGSRLSLILWLASILSLGAFSWLSRSNQPASYFMMPARFWELAVGCLVFLWQGQLQSWTRWLRPEVPLLGLVVTFFVPPSWGSLATLPCVFLTGATISTVRGQSAANRLLTTPVMTRLGLISYSLYLWHWTVLALARRVLGEITPWLLLPSFLLMLVLAGASYRWIEQPLRRASWASSPGRTIILGLAVSLTGVGALLVLNGPLQGLLYTGATSTQEVPSFKKCTKEGRRPRLLVVGDSHANSLVPMLESCHEDCLFDFRLRRTVLFPTIPSQQKESPEEVDQPTTAIEASQAQDRAIRRSLKWLRRGDTLVLASRLVCRLFDPCFSVQLFEKPVAFFDGKGERITQEAARDLYFTQVAKLARWLRRSGVNLLVVLPLPEIRSAPELCQLQWFRLTLPAGCAASERAMMRRELIVDRYEKLAKRNKNLFLFEPLEHICQADPCTEDTRLGARMGDATHLRASTSVQLAPPFSKFLRDSALVSARRR